MRRQIILGAVLAFAIPFPAFAEHPAPKPVPPVFAELQQLAGTWEGQQTSGDVHHKDESEPLKLEYELTSGGSALVEKLFKGKPWEMYSVYHPEGMGVEMTHYCMLGNQPNLRLKSHAGKTFVFDFVSAGNMSSPNEHHMHQLKLTVEDKDHLKQEWISYSNGKPEDTVVFEFKRTSSPAAKGAAPKAVENKG